MEFWRRIRALGSGGSFCGGLAGLLFMLYPAGFPAGSSLDGVVLTAALLGASCRPAADALIFKPFQYYAALVQLALLRRHIGARTQAEIIRELTLRYFLGAGAGTPASPGRLPRRGGES